MNNEIKSYRDLIYWKMGMELTKYIYALTAKFPNSELYGLTSQMRRAAVSIPSNIAEGYRRGSRKEYHIFLSYSFGSGAELETQLEISLNLKYITTVEYRIAVEKLEQRQRSQTVAFTKLDFSCS